MKSVFVLNGVVVGLGAAHQDGATVFSQADGSETFLVDDNKSVEVGWAVSEDAAGNPVFTAAPPPPKVSPIQFMLLFLPAERIKIKALEQSDPVIADFLQIMNDPRLEQVDLSLASTQQSVEYALGAVGSQMTPAYTADTIKSRMATILTGAPV